MFEAYLDEAGVVIVAGEVDVVAVPALRDTLYRALEQATGLVLVDLSRVEFIDAAGLGVLVGVGHGAEAEGKRLAVTRPSPAVVRILRILGPRAGLDVV